MVTYCRVNISTFSLALPHRDRAVFSSRKRVIPAQLRGRRPLLTTGPGGALAWQRHRPPL